MLLHAGVALPFIMAGVHATDRRSHKLVIELYGMIADRQSEEKKWSVTSAPKRVMAQQKVVKPKNQPRPEPLPDKQPVVRASPVQVEKAESKTKPTEQAPAVQTAPPSPQAAPASRHEQAEQKQQSIRHEDKDARDMQRIREYLARLKKRLQANLVYPEETRRLGIEGVPTIAFVITQTGNIKPNSLQVLKSCGYGALDSNAMRAALTSAPFEKPPKELNVSIAVSFTVTMARAAPSRAFPR